MRWRFNQYHESSKIPQVSIKCTKKLLDSNSFCRIAKSSIEPFPSHDIFKREQMNNKVGFACSTSLVYCNQLIPLQNTTLYLGDNLYNVSSVTLQESGPT